MRLALARRDLATVYRRLQSAGVSQRRIAALTGQSPSEVYEILNGRQVMAYELLLRIADGLGVPRGYLGLAYDESTERALDLAVASCSVLPDEREEVRQLLSHAANVTMGAGVQEIAKWWQPVEAARTPVFTRVGLPDVVNIESITAAMRALDYQYGGGACREAIVAQVRWAQQLLAADYADEVRHRLHIALADLHNLAGWTSFDVGLYSSARCHFARALEQARHTNNPSLVANVLYRIGRLHLHQGYFRDALKFFQLGQLAAQDAGSELTVALLCANEAWAYALLGDTSQALKSIDRAQDEFTRADLLAAPAWVCFFGLADLHAMTGIVYASLPARTTAYLSAAVEHLHRALDMRCDDQSRSRAFELTALATTHLRLDDCDTGIALGNQAVALAMQLRSVRTIDRLAPLRRETDSHLERSEARELAERIDTLQAE
ncbi:Helix-turn-helix [Micromonospora pattaloongensis]|uniref:Helix-turn-helix n=2 Tax=Micromonospora pattaloongensis TaxID=405436 RepID=A0A1H3JPH9_9ACTN|nr:Helix-turn-helix [Micromonospora pattaloongensis]